MFFVSTGTLHCIYHFAVLVSVMITELSGEQSIVDLSQIPLDWLRELPWYKFGCTN